MESVAGFESTGRVIYGPASNLLELIDDNGYRHTAVMFHDEFQDHPSIGPAVEVARGFLEDPYVQGVCELVASDSSLGAFVYPTGEAWSVGEIIRTLHDLGQEGGLRSGLELLCAAGEILVEASGAGESQGVYSHGGLTPWRLMIKKDGQVMVLGYALPQVEILQFRVDHKQVPKADSFRYCPPERLEGGAEDATTDIFGLALVAFELMTGRPVYDGLISDIRTKAARGETSRRIHKFKDSIPKPIRQLLTVCLKPSVDGRHPNPGDFLEEARRILSSEAAEGPSLIELMSIVTSVERRPEESFVATKTVGLSIKELRAMALAELSEDDEPIRKKFVHNSNKAKKNPNESGNTTDTRDVSELKTFLDEAEMPEEQPQAEVDEPIDEPETVSDGEDLLKKVGLSSDRWKKVSGRGRRKKEVAKKSEEKSEEEEAAELAKSGEEKGRSDSSKAADLLGALRSSGSRPVRNRPGSAKDSISSILGKSAVLKARISAAKEEELETDSVSAVVETPAVAEAPVVVETPAVEEAPVVVETPAVAEAPGVVEAAAPPVKSGLHRQRRRRPVRRRREAPPLKSTEQEASLVETNAPAVPEPVVEVKAPAAPEPVAVEVKVPAAPEPPAVEVKAPAVLDLSVGSDETLILETPRIELPEENEDEEDDGCSTVMLTRPVKTPKPEPEVIPPTANPSWSSLNYGTAPGSDPKPVPKSSLEPVPAPEASSDLGQESKVLTLLLELDGKGMSVEVPAGFTVASACGYLIGGKLPLETDLEGTIVASWRLGDDSGPADGMAPVESLGPCPTLYRVEAKSIMVDVMVKSEPSQRFRTRVSSTVRVGSLIAGIISWCELDGGSWSLNHDDVSLDASLLVEELPKSGLVLEK